MDFYTWTQEQAALLRAGRLNELDSARLAEEIESMGASERRELINRIKVLIAHLLKWQAQPAYRTPSWEATIDEQREQIEDLLHDNPSLKPHLADFISTAYPRAVRLAIKETGLARHQFPGYCPWPLSKIFDISFYPS